VLSTLNPTVQGCSVCSVLSTPDVTCSVCSVVKALDQTDPVRTCALYYLVLGSPYTGLVPGRVVTYISITILIIKLGKPSTHPPCR